MAPMDFLMKQMPSHTTISVQCRHSLKLGKNTLRNFGFYSYCNLKKKEDEIKCFLNLKILFPPLSDKENKLKWNKNLAQDKKSIIYHNFPQNFTNGLTSMIHRLLRFIFMILLMKGALSFWHILEKTLCFYFADAEI